jgi:signal transduction histidine kinase
MLRSSDPGDEPGLAQLPALLDATRASGLRIDVAVDYLSVSPDVELAAYRIVQEALTNVVRHANASTAAVTLRAEDACLVVSVVDDGQGAVGDTCRPGRGLTGMIERASAVGGDVEVGSPPGGGFRVVARLPRNGAAR